MNNKKYILIFSSIVFLFLIIFLVYSFTRETEREIPLQSEIQENSNDKIYIDEASLYLDRSSENISMMMNLYKDIYDEYVRIKNLRSESEIKEFFAVMYDNNGIIFAEYSNNEIKNLLFLEKYLIEDNIRVNSFNDLNDLNNSMLQFYQWVHVESYLIDNNFSISYYPYSSIYNNYSSIEVEFDLLKTQINKLRQEFGELH